MGKKFITYNGTIVGDSGLTLLSVETSNPTPQPFTNTKSIALDGVDDYVTMGNVLNMANDGTDAYSLSCWFKTTSTSTQMMISKQINVFPYNGYNLYMSANRLKFSFGTLTTSSYINGETGLDGSITDGQWHNVVLTYDGSQDISGFNLYYDGVDTTIFTIVNNTPASVSNTADFNISGRGSAALFFNGNIDEASYFNSQLSTSDVTAIYGSGVPNDISSLSPLGWWRCGDGDTAPTLTDNGSGGNDGTMTNFSTFSSNVPTMPFSTKSIVLDGVDDRVDCGNDSSLQITGALTLSAWIKTTDNSVYEIIIGKDSVSSGTRSYMLYKVGSKARFLIFNGPSSLETVTSNINVTDGNWHHIMGVNDGTDLKIYVDGTLDGTNVGGGGTVYNGTSPFYIGMRAASPANRGYFTGTIDEVAVWNTDQSANASAIGGTIPTDLTSYNPISWWRCGDGDTAPTLTDNGSASNDGTMQNFSTFSTDVP